MEFYGDFFGHSKVRVVFLERSEIFDERSNAIRKAGNSIFYIPTETFSDAYEIFVLTTYSYDVFLSKKEEKIFDIYIPSSEKKDIEKKIPLIEAIVRARNIVNLPPSDTRPEAFIEHIEAYPWKNFELQIMNAEELKKLGCNLLLAVGAGSDYPPYMVILSRIIDKKLDTYALIGKGVTFDAGGIQIKPDTAMLDMKCDMSGAAGMLGVAEYLDGIENLPCNVVVGL
jgi:leucyl aminopeptidase